MIRFFNYLLTSLLTIFVTCSAAESTFASTYQQWVARENNFVHYIDEYDQARVIFIGSEAYSSDGQGQVPTVSEGMGYGLLLAYANDDQVVFDKFLRYVIATANNYGCGLFDAQAETCLAASPFLMPWMVNERGMPFWYQAPSSAATYTSGSASDADWQIAWAIYLAAEKVKTGAWQETSFNTIAGKMTYPTLFETMGKAIRLSDVDFETLIFTPGNQWGAAGSELMFPGYFTPQAFDALNTLPKIDVSDDCPQESPLQEPPNSLLLVYKNNVTKAVSIDYMGGSGTVAVDQNFIPKPDNSTGYVVSAVTTASATSASQNPYYNNLTFQATFYGEAGQPIFSANYYFEFKDENGVLEWRVTDRGSSPEAKVCLVGNVAHVFLTEPNIEKINFDWNTVKTNSLLAIQTFQESHQTGLFPNTVYFSGEYPNNSWNRSFAYDAIRFPLWSAPYAYTTNMNDSTSALQRTINKAITGYQGVEPFIQLSPEGYSMPTNGIEVFTHQPLGDYSSAPPALNAPLVLLAKLEGNSKLYEQLIPSVTSYQITAKQPEYSDPIGDSGPYFNAILLLLSEAFLNNKL